MIRDVLRDEWLLTEGAYALYRPCMGHPSMDEYTAEMRLLRETEGARAFAFFTGEEPVGILTLVGKTGDSAEIVGIAVREDMRKKGIALSLIRTAARTLSLRSVEAETDDDAVAFYRAAGFSTEGFIRRFSDGECRRYRCRWTIPTE